MGEANNTLHRYYAYNITEFHMLISDILSQFLEVDLEQQPPLISRSTTNEHKTIHQKNCKTGYTAGITRHKSPSHFVTNPFSHDRDMLTVILQCLPSK